MNEFKLEERDRRQLESLGIEEARFLRELRMFRTPPRPPVLIRPATVGDGIQRFGAEAAAKYIATFDKKRHHTEPMKFVPASGAATRMFKVPLRFLESRSELEARQLWRSGKSRDPNDAAILQMIRGIEAGAFAFTPVLDRALAARGLSLSALCDQGGIKDILGCLLLEDGLNYAHLPKALIPFHRYGSVIRTPMEEHLIEGIAYSASGGLISIHFTLSPEFLPSAQDHLKEIIPRNRETGRQFDISFSVQSPSTHTPAVDIGGQPLRDENGDLIFRPGGHGALLGNLNQLAGDLIFIKNIDNVSHGNFLSETTRYKKILAGYLLSIQDEIHHHLRKMSFEGHSTDIIQGAETFLRHSLIAPPPPEYESWGEQQKKEYLVHRLDRPVRVCGMVKNEGEPGGGPFWVKDPEGHASMQIVEAAQVDRESGEQQSLLKTATHFNPVDLVCAVRDFRGRRFDLNRFVEPEAYFVSEKSIGGRPVKALEHPGLWNGAMARWITLMVEVPLSTFTPVKTVNDLLRPEHQ